MWNAPLLQTLNILYNSLLSTLHFSCFIGSSWMVVLHCHFLCGQLFQQWVTAALLLPWCREAPCASCGLVSKVSDAFGCRARVTCPVVALYLGFCFMLRLTAIFTGLWLFQEIDSFTEYLLMFQCELAHSSAFHILFWMVQLSAQEPLCTLKASDWFTVSRRLPTVKHLGSDQISLKRSRLWMQILNTETSKHKLNMDTLCFALNSWELTRWWCLLVGDFVLLPFMFMLYRDFYRTCILLHIIAYATIFSNNEECQAQCSELSVTWSNISRAARLELVIPLWRFRHTTQTRSIPIKLSQST